VHETAADNLAEIFRGSNCFAAATALCWLRMSEPNENPRRYKWPWFVLAAVLLFLALSVLWVGFAANREKQERNYNAPIPSGAK
jgi:ABC-type transport system involved in cytochrome c biogenesis permease subunit